MKTFVRFALYNEIMLRNLILSIIFFIVGDTILYSQDTTKNSEFHYDINIAKKEKGIKKIDKLTKKMFQSSIWKNWNIGFMYGATQFDGDIRQYDHYPAYQETGNFYELRSALSVSINKNINPLITLQAELITGNFAGLRRDRFLNTFDPFDPYNFYQGQGEKFTTSFKEIDGSVLINLSNGMSFFTKNVASKRYTFYGKIGIGYNIYNSVKRNLLSDEYIYSYGYEDEDQYGGTIKKSLLDSPKENDYIYGLIFSARINQHIQLNTEITRRVGNTDKWDASIEQINTTKQNDSYVFYGLGISYTLQKNIQEEEWQSPLDNLKNSVNSINANLEGISGDSDSDGVSDSFDKDPYTPMGVAVDGAGIPLDVDMDNIADYIDADPFSTRGAIVDANGVEFDQDRDGVPDSKDLEINTPIGSIVNQYGINVGNKNITHINNNETGYLPFSSLEYLPSIYFEVGSAFISNSNLKRLTTIAQIMIKNKDIKMKVIGNTDYTGSPQSNLELGQERAEEVVKYLSETFGINRDRYIIESQGENNPLAITRIQESHEANTQNKLSINRRVDFEIIY